MCLLYYFNGWCYTIMCWHMIIGWCYCHMNDVKPYMGYVDWLIFFKNRIKFWDCRQNFHKFLNMASSRSEENVNLRHFPTQDGVTVLVSPAILLDSCGFILLWQMFKPLVYDIMMLFWLMLLPYCHINATFVFCLADVIALLHWWLG